MTAIAEVAPGAAHTRTQSRTRLAAWFARAIVILRNVGPYAVIEILLPGGTLMALLLWLYRRRSMSPQVLKDPLSLPISSWTQVLATRTNG